MHAILGKKIGMTQVFDEEGSAIPVTVVEAGPCPVVQRKTAEKDGYTAVQIGFGDIREKLVNRPKQGHFKKHGSGNLRYLKEFRVEDPTSVPDTVKVDIFEAGQKVDVSGVSKGKGYTGVMKRHGFGGGGASHGVSKIHRMPNSIGSVDAARVFKGRKMPGQHGSRKVTTLGLKVVKVDAEKNLILIKGAVPGANGGLITIRHSVKK